VNIKSEMMKWCKWVFHVSCSCVMFILMLCSCSCSCSCVMFILMCMCHVHVHVDVDAHVDIDGAALSTSLFSHLPWSLQCIKKKMVNFNQNHLKLQSNKWLINDIKLSD
jgi:hypothetical protein